MSTLIIRDLDERLANKLKREAKKRDLSVNRLLHQLIASALAPASAHAKSANYAHDCLRPQNDLAKFAGGRTSAEEAEFLGATSTTREIDPEMWR